MRTRNGNLTRTMTALTASATFCGLGLATLLGGCGSSDTKSTPAEGGTSSTNSSAVGATPNTTTGTKATDATGGSSSSGTKSGSASGGASTSGSKSGSGTGGSSSKGGSSGSAKGGASSSATGPGLWALINVDLTSSPDDAKIAGFPKNGPALPEYNFKDDPKTVGDCKLYEVARPFCGTCETGKRCIGTGEEGTCLSPPTPIGMGTLTVDGLKLASGSTDPFSLTPINNSYESAGSTDLDVNPCAPGDAVKVSGGADDGPKFDVTSYCIERLKITSTSPLPFEPDKSTTLTWEPPSVTDKSRITARFDISHHGGLGGIIMCETDDDGSLEIDGSLVSGLISFGTAGYPVVLVTRVSTGKVQAGSGEVSLNVQSKIEKDLKIPGIDSCASNDDCANSSAGPVCSTGRKCVAQ